MKSLCPQSTVPSRGFATHTQDMKHHDRYAIAASLLMGSFLLNALKDMGWTASITEAGLLDWTSWILGTAGILFFYLAIHEHRKRH